MRRTPRRRLQPQQRLGYAVVGQMNIATSIRVAPPRGRHMLEERGADRRLGEHLHAGAACPNARPRCGVTAQSGAGPGLKPRGE